MLRWGSALLMAASLFLVPAASASSAPAPAKDKVVTFGLGPASSAGVDGRPYYYYLGSPGTRLSDHVIVLNYSNQPLPLAVYATDGFNTYAGSSDLLEASVQPIDVGSWVTVKSPRRDVVVPARKNNRPGSLLLPFSLAVPSSAEPGDHVGGIVAALRTHAKNAKGFVVDLDQRVAVQVFLRVSGELRPQLKVADLSASYVGTLNPFGTGSARISYTVRNTGNVRLGGRQRVTVSGFAGSWSATGLADVPLLVPGGSAHVSAVVHGVWPEFWMKGAVTVQALGLTTDVNPVAPIAKGQRHFWAVPWTLIALLVALLALSIWWRRRRPRAEAPGPAPVRESVGVGWPEGNRT